MSSLLHRRALRERVALVIFCALLSSLLVSAFVHTDDGCAVERHCSSCVFALHHADGADLPRAEIPLSRPTELAVPLPPARLSGEARIHASRGPPSA
jgi:hypothetical protein